MISKSYDFEAYDFNVSCWFNVFQRVLLVHEKHQPINLNKKVRKFEVKKVVIV